MIMFDWFGKKDKDSSNVIPFPENKSGYHGPEGPAEKPTQTFYRIGVTDNQRVAFQMGYTEITMTRLGVQQLIEQLTVFMNQLPEDKNDEE